MADELKGKTIAVLVTDGFEQVEMTGPRSALEAAGAKVEIVSPAGGKVKGWKTTDWGDAFDVDVKLDDAKANHYDALILPGGVMSPDKLRVLPAAQQLVRAFFDAKKPVAAICHGPWTLIDAGVVARRRMTSWRTLETDLRNAGAEWVDEEVVVDGTLVTSRKPDDIPAFNREVIALVRGERRGEARRPQDAPDRAGLAPLSWGRSHRGA
jgi:protease I